MSIRRLRWGDLSREARAAVEGRHGAVLKVEAAEGGNMPGVAARLRVEGGGSLFLKAIPVDDPAAGLYARERTANLALGPDAPAPRMLWSDDAGGWAMLAFEFVHGARNVDLSPASPDLPGVLDALSRLGGPGGALPGVAVNLEILRRTAARLLSEKPDGAAMYAEALEALSLEALEGEALLHYDLHPGNLLTTGQAICIIDWAFACRGQGWIDAALLVPRLIAAGHSPAQAEALVGAHPGWGQAPADAVTGLATLWTMFREYKAARGPMASRGFRVDAARAGRSWISHRMS